MNTEPKELELKPEPYRLSVAELAYVAKLVGVNKDLAPHALLFERRGNLVLGSTDTHRLHAVVLGPIPENWEAFKAERGYEAVESGVLVDIRRLIFEAKYHKATDALIEADLSGVLVQKYPKGRFGFRGHPDPAIACAYDVLGVKGSRYPAMWRVIPDTVRPIGEYFAINRRYLVDAVSLSTPGERIYAYSEKADSRSIVFTGNGRWLSVVMPMGIDEDGVLGKAFDPESVGEPKGGRK